MKNKNLTKSILLLFMICVHPIIAYDLTIIGYINYADGIGRIPIGIMALFKDDLDINCIPVLDIHTSDLDENVQSIVFNPDKTFGKVSIMLAPIWVLDNQNIYREESKKSEIKIAYSMIESTILSSQWVKILNMQFDAVVVPDPFLVDVYRNSGVSIPIFFLPLGMFLDDFLQKPKRSRNSVPFVFGTTVSCQAIKNYGLLIESFAEEFGNSKEVVLKLNARGGESEIYKNLIQSLGVSNIIFTNDILNKSDYLEFMDSFHCFINISKGEGFSLCPREALALGIPCILSKNSAQITLCNTGFVREVPSLVQEPINYFWVSGKKMANNLFTCAKKDVRDALRDVFTNYSLYQKKAEGAPKWVSQYRWSNLKNKYLSLIQPSRIILGDQNLIEDDFLMTNSPALYKKYNKAFPWLRARRSINEK